MSSGEGFSPCRRRQIRAAAGLLVVGVHSPEFAFAHVTREVAAQAEALGVRYPVAFG